MRTKHYLESLRHDTDTPVAYFGSARLVRTQAGRLEVRGGTKADHAEACEWTQRFLTPPALQQPRARHAKPHRRPGGTVTVTNNAPLASPKTSRLSSAGPTTPPRT